MASQGLLVYKFELLYKMDCDDIINRLEREILEETRIIIEDYEQTSLSGIYIYSEIYKEREYNFEKNIFVDLSTKKYITVNFHIDLANKLLDIWGSKKGAQRVITGLSLAFDNKVIIDAYTLDINKIINYMRSKDNIKVNKIKANGILLEHDLLADCTFDLSDRRAPFETIAKYKDNIQRIALKYVISNEEVAMTLYKTGAVTVHKNRQNIKPEGLLFIYEMLLAAGR